ncbi:MAG: hypothetical protein ACFFCE_01125 [Promethearchaeota archaeon]
MVEDNNNLENNSKIESELFALVKSITTLNNKYQKGIVNENFFRKTLKNAMNNLLKLNLVLKENHIQMADLLKEMNLSQEYNSVIEIINRVSSINMINDTQEMKKHTFLELPGITSEITSSFITLMDALTLEGLRKKDLILKLFNELNHHLGNFPGLDDILSESELIQKNIQNHFDKISSNSAFNDKLIDELYQLFKEFQNRLHIQP